MFSRSILKTFLLTTIVLAAVAIASAASSAGGAAANSAGSIHTYLTPDLSLKTTFLVPAQPSAVHGKTCRCSCGTARCATDADCGGGEGSCSAFISCCAKGNEAQSSRNTEQSCRKNELPAFQANCN